MKINTENASIELNKDDIANGYGPNVAISSLTIIP